MNEFGSLEEDLLRLPSRSKRRARAAAAVLVVGGAVVALVAVMYLHQRSNQTDRNHVPGLPPPVLGSGSGSAGRLY
jgi:ferric-dicitrate binding protein FerR (iron transport regulator)